MFFNLAPSGFDLAAGDFRHGGRRFFDLVAGSIRFAAGDFGFVAGCFGLGDVQPKSKTTFSF
jgi:hypothetical protein